MSSTKLQVVYKLDGIDADDGVDVFEIAPVLMHFGELVRSANSILGFDKKIDVKIKPVRAGSWIADFVFQQTQIQNLLNHLSSQEGQNLMLLMAFLGLNVKDGVLGVAGIIRFTHGKVTNFFKNPDKETVTYTSPTGETTVVSMAEHRLVQSPVIQNNYYNCVIAPLDKFPTATAVAVQSVGDPSIKAQVFTRADQADFASYATSDLLEDVEESISTMSGVYLKPKRGSYSGEERQYSFVMGEGNVLWPVTIEDEDFLLRLRSGELRLYFEDVLKADMEVRQKKDPTNKIMASYVIKRVTEYNKYEKPRQLGMNDLLDKKE